MMTPSGGTLTQAQSEYLEDILSDRSKGSPTLSTYDSCGYLEIDLKEHLKEEMRVNLGTGSYYYGGWGMVDDMVMVAESEMAMDSDGGMDMDSAPSAGPESSQKTSSGGEEGVDFSGTNNQEQGVDEADFVKTDGSYIYLVNQGYSDWGVYPSGKVHILEIPEVGDVSYLSNISIEGYPNEMLLVDDKAVIYSNVYIYSYYEEKHPLDDIVKSAFKRETKSVESSPATVSSSEEEPAEPKEETSDEEKEDSESKEDSTDSDFYFRSHKTQSLQIKGRIKIERSFFLINRSFVDSIIRNYILPFRSIRSCIRCRARFRKRIRSIPSISSFLR